MIGQFCIFRTYSAGVHCGILEEINGKCALVREEFGSGKGINAE